MRFHLAFLVPLLQCLSCCEPVTAAKKDPTTPGADKAGCTQSSGSVTWDVNGLYYQRSDIGGIACINPSGQCPSPYVPLYAGSMAFDLVNRATGDSRHCDVLSGFLSDVEESSPDWLPCEGGLVLLPRLPQPSSPGHSTTTHLRFNHTANKLELNQTWYCHDLADEYKFNAYGALSPTLDPSVHFVGDRGAGQIKVNAISPNMTVSATVQEEKLASTMQRG